MKVVNANYATILGDEVLLHDEPRSWRPSREILLENVTVSYGDNGVVTVTGLEVACDYVGGISGGPTELPESLAREKYDPSEYYVTERTTRTWWGWVTGKHSVAVMHSGWARLRATKVMEINFTKVQVFKRG